MRRFIPPLWLVILCHVLAVAAFILRITSKFIPLIANSLSIAVFVFAASGLITFVLYIFGGLWHPMVKAVVIPATLLFGLSMLFYVFIFTSFSFMNAEKIHYNGNVYYYSHDSTTYTSYSLYKQEGIRLVEVMGMTPEERRLPYEQDRVEALIQRLDN